MMLMMLSETSLAAAPTLVGTSAGAVNDNTTTNPFSDVTVSDPDIDNVSVTIIYTAANGTLSGTGITGIAGNYTVTSAAPDTATINLQGIVFTPTANQVAVGSTVVTTFTLTPNDGTQDGSADSATQITATSINDAPSFNAGTTLAPVNEDAASPAGTTVTSLLDASFSDVDPSSSMAGIAVTADASSTGVEGDWEYTTDGSTWFDIGTVSTSSALLLPSTSKLRFVPFNHYNGTPGSLTVYAVDNSSATTFTSDATQQTFDTTSDDDTSKVSAAGVSVETSVTAVNDDPTIASLPAMVTVTEDTASNVDLSAATLSDVDSASASITLTIAAGTGTLTATSGGGVTIAGSGTTTITLTGTVVNIDTFLDTTSNIKYTGASNATGNNAAILTLTANDAGNTGSGGGTDISLGTVNVDITAVADIPNVTDTTTNEDIQSSAGLVISRNVNDDAEVTHFKTTNISGGTLYKNDGTTPISNNSFITFAEGNAGLKFTPTANSISSGSFEVQAGTDGSGGGLSAGSTTATIIITPIGDTPSVTGASTNEDTQTTSGLVISRNVNDGNEVTHFKVTDITGGTLFKNNGTTPISNNSFITVAEGNAGLKFTPTANSNINGSFDIQAATDAIGGGLSTGTATATITVSATADTPSVTNASTNEDTQSTSGLVISRNTNDGTEVTHFKITGISGGTLYQNNGTTPISNNSFITVAEGNAGLKFTPTANSNINGSFDIQAATDAIGGGLSTGTATATITVSAAADTPSVTNASTNEDTQSTSGLVISRNTNDGTEVTHFKTTNISGGTLYKNDGTTPISNNSFITFAEGNAGLKFTPTANSISSGSFEVQAGTDGSGGGLSAGSTTATIIITPIGDTPSVTGASTNEDTQTTSGLVISRNVNDGNEVTHFKVTDITGGTLFKNNGTTPISNNSFITVAEGNAGLKFTPTANSNINGSFDIQAATDAIGGGLSTGTATATITVSATADTPSVTNASTNEDTQSTSGLVISRNTNDGTEVTHFKITNISGGTLYKNDGTTPISNNSFITFAEGNAGLKFTPTANSISSGSFEVQAGTDDSGGGLSAGSTTATITITAIGDVPSVTNASTDEDQQSSAGLVISRNTNDSTEVTHFKITDITGGALYQNNGTTPISNNSFITFAEGNAGLKFTPTANSISSGSFNVQASTDGSGGGLSAGSVTATISIAAIADVPSVTNANTNEDTQSSAGLVISRNANDGNEVTHFKITGITGGTLYKNDGTTAIANNSFITFPEGNAGLKFTPTANSNNNGSFNVQAATDDVGSGLSVGSATATITITVIGDAPSVTNTSTDEDTQSTTGLVISRNVNDGTEVTHFKISSISGGTLYKNDGTTAIANNSFITFVEGNAGLKFTPTVNSLSSGSFDVQAGTDGSGGGLSAGSATATITITPIGDTPRVTNTSTNEDTQSTTGLVISRNVNDGTEVTHFKITNITGGTLYKNDGTTAIDDDSFITVAEGNAGLKFTPTENSSSNGSFDVQAAMDGVGSGLSAGSATATITITVIGDGPSVTNASTIEDTQSTTGLVISRNVNDGTEVTHFKITNITGGTLYKNDGTTAIANNSFITFVEGNAGLKFTPTANSSSNGSFNVQAATDDVGSGLSAVSATATITISPVGDTPRVTNTSTSEDTQSTGGLVISRNINDGNEVTHFKINSITGGTLYKNDGTTAIANNSFITVAEGNAGLKFTPTANSSSNGSFNVQAATDVVGSGLSVGSATATITITPIGDTPSVTNTSTNEDTQSTTGLVISRNINDGNEVTHFKISSISGGTLYKNDGTTAIANNSFITFVEGNAGLKFTPTVNSLSSGSFDVQAGTDGSGGGLSAGSATATITITPIGDTPRVTNTSTNEDTQSTTGLVISRNVNDGTEVTHFKITNITGGTLYKNDGTTAIDDDSFITFAEGDAGLKFTPTANSSSNGSFNVQSATNESDVGLSVGSAMATITISPVGDTPRVTNTSTNEDTQSTSGLVISRNINDTNEVTHFKITNITGGTLYKNNGTTSISNNSFITVAEGNAGLKFTPTANSFGSGSFNVQAGTDGSGGGLSAGSATATITITAIGDVPSVTNASTNEDTQSSAGLVISRNINDGDEVTHFKITGVTGGTLYKNNGITPISNNRLITIAEGNAGLKFTPAINRTADGVFSVQAATNSSGGGLSVGSASATIAITPVNDAPTITHLNGDSVSFSIGGNAVVLDANGNAALSDIDSANFSGGNVTASITINAENSEDLLQIGSVGNISTSGSNVIHTDDVSNSVSIGTFAGGAGGNVLGVALNANATLTRVRDLLSALQYRDIDAGTLNTNTRTVRITVNDGDGGSATSADQNVFVTLLRAPIIDLDGDDSSGATNGSYHGSFSEDGGAVAAADSDSTISDDGSFKSLTVTLINRPDGGAAESLVSTYGVDVPKVNDEEVTIGAYNSGTGELTISVNDGSAVAATIEMLMQSIRYNNTSDLPDTTNRRISFMAVDNDDHAGAISTAEISISSSNDSPVGSVTINGSAIEHLQLSADASAVSDADGLGTFNYQWKRNDSTIAGATSANYTLVRADVGAAISVVASYSDGGGTSETVTSATTSAVQGDLDNDAVVDGSDPDIDGDGMSNSYEDANGLNKLSAADRNSDLDGDGVSNYDESVAATDAGADDYPPVISVPADITVDAVGLFTPVDVGTASANDALDGSVSVSSDAPAYFRPGANTVTWSATDTAGNTATASQMVNVVPLVELSKDQTTAEGAAATFKVILNGPAVSYPVAVPISISGTADSTDHDLVSSDIVIASGQSTDVTVNIVDADVAEGMETLIVTLGASPTNAVVGPKSSHTMRIQEGNVAPAVTLSADQGAGSTRLVEQGAADVVVTASVADPNPGDTHTYDWSATDNALSDSDGAVDAFTFSPTTIGIYTLRVTVIDNSNGNLSDTAELIVRVLAALPTLAATDSDSDGSNDNVEGSGDSDSDGVPDYLDHSALQVNALQAQAGIADQFVLETEPGLSLKLGEVAFRTGDNKAKVTTAEIGSHANGGAGAFADDEYAYDGSLFDFEVSDLPIAGQSVSVVIPQQVAIPADALYRKLQPSGWATFVEDGNNSLASTAGAEGYCPPPGDSTYSAGLSEDHWCIQLTIEDGGPNDADNAANQQVQDPGGVAVRVLEPVNITITGGGAFSPWLLSVLGALLLIRRSRRYGAIAVAMICLPNLAQAAAIGMPPEEPVAADYWPDYVGVSYLKVSGKDRSDDFNRELENLGLTGNVSQTDLNRNGLSVYVGYRLQNNVQIELEYADAGEVSTSINGTAVDVDDFVNNIANVYPATADFWTLSVGKGWQTSHWLSFQASIGAFIWQAEYQLGGSNVSRVFSENGMGVRFALGVEAMATDQLPVRLGWRSYRFDDTAVNAWDVGVGYRF